ncbi:MAG: carboxypeptidase regulatory-like domain-containing protein [Segetibacter sp.]
MKKIITFLTFSFFCTALGFGQTANIKGSITDTLNKQNLSNTVVSLLKAKDSVLVKFTRSVKSGNFEMKNLPPGKFFLMISYPKYADYIYQLTLKDGLTEDIGIIKMTLKSRLLEEVLVKQKVAAIRMKGDTIEYNTDSFKVREGASVEEMLRKMPGLQVDKDGKITAQGQKVEKVLVDGEEFLATTLQWQQKTYRQTQLIKYRFLIKKVTRLLSPV